MNKRGSNINMLSTDTNFEEMCERYDVIAEQTNLVIFDINFEDDTFYVSENFMELTGISLYNQKNSFKHLLGLKYIHPSDLLRFKEFIRTASPDQASTSITFRRRTENNELMWVRCKRKCYFNEDGRLTRVLGTAQEVSKEMVTYTVNGNDLLMGVNIPTFSRFEYKTRRIRRTNPDKKFAVIVFDIKRFSVINDLYGNKEGDGVLKYIGTVLSSNTAGCYAYCRLYSDNFAVFTEYRNESEIYDFALFLKKQMKEYPLKMEISFSIGVCLVESKDLSMNVLCERATLTKKTIKNDVMKTLAFYEDSLRKRTLEDSDIENEMISALSNNHFEMYLQPKMSIPTTEVVGAEALVRWNHPEKGIIPPERFIQLFEKNGFIISLDYFIWEKAFQTIAKWMKEDYPVIPISINVSRIHFSNSDFVDKLMYISEKYQVPPTYIELEITESAFFNYKTDLQSKLYTLKEKGFRLSLDDFGTGYSTLNFLKDIPLDILKMDKAFLDGTGENRKEETVLEYTIALARSLGIEVVAEGVENFSQAEFLYRSGCEIAQGYFYSPPLPVASFERYAGLTK